MFAPDLDHKMSVDWHRMVEVETCLKGIFAMADSQLLPL